MKLIEFMKRYPTEESCKEAWKAIRIKQGVVCPVCGGIVHYWKSDKECFECASCHYRQSLRANTVMHGSQLPFRYWFIAMHLLTSTKKSISALEVQRQLGHKNYAPIWAMMHKLRLAMGERDSRYGLDGTVELDEGFFTTEVPVRYKEEPLKRGRGSQRKTKVLVMAESEPVDGPAKPGRKPRAVKHVKMRVIKDLASNTIDPLVEEYVGKDSVIDSDGSTSYSHFSAIAREHRPKVIPKGQVGNLLPWVHIAISNAKRLLLDIHHDIGPAYLQSYLDEFCWKFNRRYFGDALFERLLITGAAHKNEFRYNIA